jgi:hypothetical protein
MTSPAPPQVSGKLRWSAGLLTIVVAIATFDPHFENFEFMTYILRTFLPELTILGLVAGMVLASRTGLFFLVVRHRLVFAALALIVLWAAHDLFQRATRSAVGVGGEDLETFTARPVPTIAQWAGGRSAAYSRSQPEFFRKDMTLRAVDAFYAHDFSGAAAYLRASGAIFPRNVADTDSDDGLAFLTSRQLYLLNHKARAAGLASQHPLAPVRLYMLRVVSQLQRDDQQEPELVALNARIRVAGADANSSVRTCLLNRPVPSISADGKAMVNLTLDAMGNYTQWGNGISGAQWCRTLRGNFENEASGATFVNGFDTLVRNLWGSALYQPKQAKESGAPLRKLRPDPTDDEGARPFDVDIDASDIGAKADAGS